MSLGGLVGEPIEVAAENVCRRPGPIDGQQLRRQLRIVERDPAKGVDQERPHDETLFGIVVGVSPEGFEHRTESRHEPPILGCQGGQIPAIDRQRP